MENSFYTFEQIIKWDLRPHLHKDGNSFADKCIEDFGFYPDEQSFLAEDIYYPNGEKIQPPPEESLKAYYYWDYINSSYNTITNQTSIFFKRAKSENSFQFRIDKKCLLVIDLIESAETYKMNLAQLSDTENELKINKYILDLTITYLKAILQRYGSLFSPFLYEATRHSIKIVLSEEKDISGLSVSRKSLTFPYPPEVTKTAIGIIYDYLKEQFIMNSLDEFTSILFNESDQKIEWDGKKTELRAFCDHFERTLLKNRNPYKINQFIENYFYSKKLKITSDSFSNITHQTGYKEINNLKNDSHPIVQLTRKLEVFLSDK